MSAPVAAARLSAPVTSAPESRAATSRADASARAASREPMTMGWPTRAQRSARPCPCGPVPPRMAILELMPSPSRTSADGARERVRVARRRHDHGRERRRLARSLLPVRRGQAIECVALPRHAAERPDERLHRRGWQLLAVLRAGGARDALVHERAAQIVGARGEAELHALDA